MQGFASRDIKLDNVLLDGSKRPLMKLCDFGYSKVKFSFTVVVRARGDRNFMM